MRERGGVSLSGFFGITALFCAVFSPDIGFAQKRVPGEKPLPTSIEAGLWAESAKSERQASTSAERVIDPKLDAYVKSVSCRIAPDYCQEVRVYVMDRPVFNATAAPNGYIEVWSGLLLTAANEAEFAFVLGHEIAHYESRHSVAAFEQEKSSRMVANAASLAIALVGVAVASNQTTIADVQDVMDTTRSIMNITYIGVIASYFRFSREQETQADALGHQRLARAGYLPRASTDIWRTIVALANSSDYEKVRKRPAKSSVFNTHPVTEVRIAALDSLSKAAPPDGETKPAEYRDAIRPHLRKWLTRDLERRDFGQTLQLIERLTLQKTDLGVLYFMRGETYRKRDGATDARSAVDAYSQALEHKDAPVETYRELGAVAAKSGNRELARTSYQKYLELAGQSDDAWLVTEAMEALK